MDVAMAVLILGTRIHSIECVLAELWRTEAVMITLVYGLIWTGGGEVLSTDKLPPPPFARLPGTGHQSA